MALAAVALMLIGFSQTAGDAGLRAKHRYRIDINQESVAQAVANTGAGLFQGMPVSTSLSASSLNDHSGARTGFASLTSGVTVLLTLLFLAPLFSDLPKPVLAALIIEAVVMGMMNLPEMRRLYRVQRSTSGSRSRDRRHAGVRGAGRRHDRDRPLAAVADLGYHPPRIPAGRQPGTQVFRELSEHPDDEPFPGVVVVRLDGGLFFATSDALEDRIRQLIHRPPPDRDRDGLRGHQLRRLPGCGNVDDIVELCEEAGITLRLARLKPSVRPPSRGTVSSRGSDPTTSMATSSWRSRPISPPPQGARYRAEEDDGVVRGTTTARDVGRFSRMW